MKVSGQKTVLSSIHDITRRKKTEELLSSSLAELETTNKRLNIKIRETETVHQQINSELEQARLAQLALLPREVPKLEDVRLAKKYIPMTQIGGDFYDLFITDEEKPGIVVGFEDDITMIGMEVM